MHPSPGSPVFSQASKTHHTIFPSVTRGNLSRVTSKLPETPNTRNFAFFLHGNFDWNIKICRLRSPKTTRKTSKSLRNQNYQIIITIKIANFAYEFIAYLKWKRLVSPAEKIRNTNVWQKSKYSVSNFTVVLLCFKRFVSALPKIFYAQFQAAANSGSLTSYQKKYSDSILRFLNIQILRKTLDRCVD